MPPGSLATPYGRVERSRTRPRGRGPVVILHDPVAGLFARPTLLREVLSARFNGGRVDADLARGADPERDAVTFLRASRLVSRKIRDETASSLLSLVDRCEWQPPWSSPSSFVQRQRVVGAVPALTALAVALSGSSPVRPRGVAMARQLLTDGAGPVYRAATPDTIVAMAEDALRALEA